MIPIHTEDPGAFAGIARDIAAGGGPAMAVIMPEAGRRYEL